MAAIAATSTTASTATPCWSSSVAKHLLLIAAFLCTGYGAGYANADNSKANTTTVVDQDGFTEPMTKLKFNPGLDQREFERSTLNALNVYDPLESWNRR